MKTFPLLLAGAAGLAALAIAGQALAAGCTIGRIAELPVTMIGDRPVVSATINGQDARFVADSGAFYSLITHANAEKYGLSLREAPFGFNIEGVTGSTDVKIGTAKTFILAGIPVPRAEFFVGGSEVGAATVGLLGQNILHIADVEYDLANGAIRLFRPMNCGDTPLAYWVKPDQPYTVIKIDRTTPQQPHTVGEVTINGVKLRATFDTGAGSTVLTVQGAARAGVRTDSPGVKPAGLSSGIGQRTVKNWIAPIASFKIGDEEIKSTRMRISDIELQDSDMLLGADFFLAHRVFVATSQRKLYLTYNGGPVFNLTTPVHRQTVAAADALPPAGAPSSTPDAKAPPAETALPVEEPTDAAGFSRRGDAYLSRRQLDQALADLTKATQLAPTEPDYFYQLARAHAANRQPLLAIIDLDQALKLKPDDVSALLLRAEILMRARNKAPALADFDAVEKLASKQDDVRLRLAQAYEAADRLKPAIAQYDLWIAEHPDDYRLGQARNGRCWARALLGEELDKALGDCNAAVRMNRDATTLDSRGLVFLRMGQFDRAIADYDAALLLNPKIAWSLYGRGLAQAHKGLKAEGEADIAAAKAIAPLLAENAAAHGITPPAG